MKEFWTIGYEQIEPARFLNLLVSHRIERLVDVRDLPLSRKPGFSKSALKKRLEQQGITYEHVRRLGAPKILRASYRKSGNWRAFAAAYRGLLRSRGPEINELLQHVVGQRVCLLCFERDPAVCHRSLLAAEMVKCGGVRVTHIRY